MRGRDSLAEKCQDLAVELHISVGGNHQASRVFPFTTDGRTVSSHSIYAQPHSETIDVKGRPVFMWVGYGPFVKDSADYCYGHRYQQDHEYATYNDDDYISDSYAYDWFSVLNRGLSAWFLCRQPFFVLAHVTTPHFISGTLEENPNYGPESPPDEPAIFLHYSVVDDGQILPQPRQYQLFGGTHNAGYPTRPSGTYPWYRVDDIVTGSTPYHHDGVGSDLIYALRCHFGAMQAPADQSTTGFIDACDIGLHFDLDLCTDRLLCRDNGDAHAPLIQGDVRAFSLFCDG